MDRSLTMDMPLALEDVRMIVAACIGLEKLAIVQQTGSTAVWEGGGNRIPDTTAFADHTGAFCDSIRVHFPIITVAIGGFAHLWRNNESWLHKAHEQLVTQDLWCTQNTRKVRLTGTTLFKFLSSGFSALAVNNIMYEYISITLKR